MALRKNTATTRTSSKRKDTSKDEIGSAALADRGGIWLQRSPDDGSCERSIDPCTSSSAPMRLSSRAAVLMATIWPTGSRPKGN